LIYLRELEARRAAILDSIREQGKLDAALEASILAADSKGRLEDIYLPFKPKRRTKAEIAKEARSGAARRTAAEQARDRSAGRGHRLRQCGQGCG
jgi:protein Tex